ncbi:MAG: cytochrome c3 family protein [Desulfovibrionaceae bacterium]
MKNRYLPITIVAVALLAIGVAGYLAPSSEAGPPVRVLLDSPAGPVFFTHQKHAGEYGTECGECHHQSEDFAQPPACHSCHAKAFDESWVAGHQEAFQNEKRCRSCHHARYDMLHFDHLAHEDYGACRDCHHGPDIEPEPTRCSECHAKQSDADTPGLMTASHQRCRQCHEASFDDQSGTEGCKDCHELKAPEHFQQPYAACSTCHDKPVKELVPITGDAFHQRCMGCHEDMGAGPYGQDACNQCHR